MRHLNDPFSVRASAAVAAGEQRGDSPAPPAVDGFALVQENASLTRPVTMWGRDDLKMGACPMPGRGHHSDHGLTDSMKEWP